jgi:hypothetical protein
MILTILVLMKAILISGTSRVMPEHLRKNVCPKEWSKAVDVWLSDANYSDFLNRAKNPVLLVASHSGCKACCHFEPVFAKVRD